MGKSENRKLPRVLVADENKGFGGAERHVITLAKALNQEGLLVGLAARKRSWLANNCEDLPFHSVGFRNEVDMLSVYNLYRKIKNSGCNVVHCIGHRDLVAAALARNLPGSPKTILIKAEHSYPDTNLSPLFRWAYGQCNAITSVSQALRKQVLQAIDPGKTVATPVIHNGSEHHIPLRPVEDLKQRALRIGVLAPLRPGKGQADFLRAIADLEPANGQEIKFSIAGEGELREQLETLASELKLKVEFLGHVKEPLEYLNDLDLSVVPSHRETFSLVTAETMACGRALVCADSEGVVEICGDYPFKIYPAGDIAALTDALRAFCQDPRAAIARSHARAIQAREKFSSARMAESYRTLYRELLWAPNRSDE